MGVYQRSFVNTRLNREPWWVCENKHEPEKQHHAVDQPLAGPGLSAPFQRIGGWLEPKNIRALPGDPPVGTRIDLSVNAGAPPADDDRIVAATIGDPPKAGGGPTQFWLEYRQAQGFDRGINDGPGIVPAVSRPGVVHASRLRADNSTYFLGAAPAVVGARLNEIAGRTPRVEAVSSERPLIRLVLDPPVQYAYLFKGSSYVRYDRLANRTDAGYPRPIAAHWNGMAAAGFADGLDAVLPWFGSRLYFFKGASYLRYDLDTDRVAPGYPKPITGNWPGLAQYGFATDLDAAVNWGNESAYFFKGSKFLRYDPRSGLVGGAVVRGRRVGRGWCWWRTR